MKKRIIAIFTLATILFVATSVFAQGLDVQGNSKKLESILNIKAEPYVYIVIMAQDPAITYKGDIPGLSATKPIKGKKIRAIIPNLAPQNEYQVCSKHGYDVSNDKP